MGRLPPSLRVGGRDGLGHACHRIRVDQRDCASAEATTRHASAVRARAASGLHGHIQFFAGHFIVVTQRVVRIIQESARNRQARTFQRPLVKKLNESTRTRDLGDDVARAAARRSLPSAAVASSRSSTSTS